MIGVMKITNFSKKMNFEKSLLVVCFLLIFNISQAQVEFVSECRQKTFPKHIPAGNYSGITHIGGNDYAVVSDKSENDGFFIINIDIDSITGEIADIKVKGFLGDSILGGDCEGIAYRPSSSTFFIAKEAKASIVEYDSKGKLTGRSLDLPTVYKHGNGAYGLESLAYDGQNKLFWTINESTLPEDGKQATSKNSVRNILRLQSFNDSLQPKMQYAYMMDEPTVHSKSSEYAMGVSELAAVGKDYILVLEREFYVPKIKLGAFVTCKLYEIKPEDEYSITGDTINDNTKFLPKRLVYSFTTKLTLFDRSLANYEGMCLGPTLADGNKVLILVSDSQNGYRGVLKDWFKTIVLRCGGNSQHQFKP